MRVNVGSFPASSLKIVHAPRGAHAYYRYGRTKNDASTAETAAAIATLAARGEHPIGRAEGRGEKRREEVRDDAGGAEIWRNAERRALILWPAFAKAPARQAGDQ